MDDCRRRLELHPDVRHFHIREEYKGKTLHEILGGKVPRAIVAQEHEDAYVWELFWRHSKQHGGKTSQSEFFTLNAIWVGNPSVFEIALYRKFILIYAQIISSYAREYKHFHDLAECVLIKTKSSSSTYCVSIGGASKAALSKISIFIF